MHTLICQHVVHGEPPPLGGGQSCWHKGVVTLTVCGWKPPSFRCYGKRAMALLKDRGYIMGTIPHQLREIIARNIEECRQKKFPGRGGEKKCAEAFGVSPQQWSPWERGRRTPDETRLSQIADFFGVTVEWMRRDNRPPSARPTPKLPPPVIEQGFPDMGLLRDIAGADFPPPPSWNSAPPGSPASFFWLAHRFVMSIETHGLRLDTQSLKYLAECIKKS